MAQLLSNLTEEQESRLREIRDRWVNLTLYSAKQVRKDEIEDYITNLYKSGGYQKPEIEIYDGIQSTIEAAINLAHYQQRPKYLSEHIGITIKHLLPQIENQVDISLSDKISNIIFIQPPSPLNRRLAPLENAAALRLAFNKIHRRGRYDTYIISCDRNGLAGNAEWAIYFDFYSQIGLIKNLSGIMREWLDYLAAGVYSANYFEKTAIITRLPTKLYFDQNWRLHSLTGPAVQWADGLNNYFICGAEFPKSTWDAVVKKTITAKEAISLPDLEQRTVACQIIGYDSVLAELGARIIDKETKTMPNGKSLCYKLYRINIKDDIITSDSSINYRPAKFVRVECPSTGRETLLRVHPRVDTVEEAIAWTFGMTQREYMLDVET